MADVKIKENKTFAEQIINWYKLNKRDLPWRSTKDPYVIWLSEIILQQTRVQQGLPYFNKFLEAYPTIQDFAAAPEKEVMKLWQGLGYYSRARNMMACAQMIMNTYQGQFPSTYKELMNLKGVGRYTAAAIASFSFQETVPVIDGNVFRVLSRVYGIDQDISQSNAYSVFYETSTDLIPQKTPDIYNQAIMEFGALQCVPRSPECNTCVLEASCYANLKNAQQDFPVKTKKITKKHRHFYYFVIRYENDILIHHRKENDIWNGLYDFLSMESGVAKELEEVVSPDFENLFDQGELSYYPCDLKHILTHQVIYAKFFLLEIGHKNIFETIKEKFGLIKTTKEELESYPTSILIAKFLKSDFL